MLPFSRLSLQKVVICLYDVRIPLIIHGWHPSELKKPPSALKIWQIAWLFAMIFALNLIFLIHLATHPELIEIPIIIYKDSR